MYKLNQAFIGNAIVHKIAHRLCSLNMPYRIISSNLTLPEAISVQTEETKDDIYLPDGYLPSRSYEAEIFELDQTEILEAIAWDISFNYRFLQSFVKIKNIDVIFPPTTQVKLGYVPRGGRIPDYPHIFSAGLL